MIFPFLSRALHSPIIYQISCLIQGNKCTMGVKSIPKNQNRVKMSALCYNRDQGAIRGIGYYFPIAAKNPAICGETRPPVFHCGHLRYRFNKTGLFKSCCVKKNPLLLAEDLRERFKFGRIGLP
jgi:hypothetical protein